MAVKEFHRPCERQPRGQARLSVRRACREHDRRRALHRRCGEARRGRGAGAPRCRAAKPKRWACASSPTKIRACGLARMAAEFFGAQPNTIAAVTGTNGKSSVVALPAPDLDRAGQACRQPGHGRRGRARRRDRAAAHHARPGGNPSPAGAAETRRRRSSGAGSFQPRARPVSASTA